MMKHEMNCDICGSNIVTDCGIWRRWKICAETTLPYSRGSETSKVARDVCWDCWRKVFEPLMGEVTTKVDGY